MSQNEPNPIGKSETDVAKLESTPTTSWITHKFGGSSLADASGYRNVVSILDGYRGRQAVVVSATAGMTDGLIDLVARAGNRDQSWQSRIEDLASIQVLLVEDLLAEADARSLTAAISRDFTDIRDILRGADIMGAAADAVTQVVAGYGEIWSAKLLTAHLRASGRRARYLDARDVVVVESDETVPLIDWDAGARRLQDWLALEEPEVAVITGFIASNRDGSPTTLGRNGSDYSASIFGALLGAEEIHIWTDVDGVMTADPNLVGQAQLLPSLTYNEAVELAYFGARVIHPATMAPAITRNIPITIRNAWRPDSPGTRVHLTSDSSLSVKGFASIENIALLNLEGTAMIGVPGIAERLFSALRYAGISVVMISQGSSEHSICFATPESQAEAARRAVDQAFAAEAANGQLKEVTVTPDCVILAAVGEGMSGTPGIAAKFFGALARAGVNIRAIAQGASERNISVVIDADQSTRALRAAHSGFYLSRQTLSIGLIGPGHIGSVLLDQMHEQLERLRSQYGVDLRVRAIANSSKMVIDEDRIDLASWRDLITAADSPVDLDRLASFVHTEAVPHAAIIDCTADANIAMDYGKWLADGIHVITPNKKANSSDFGYYQELRSQSRRADAHYFYETTVGAALPVIQTLRDLVQTGDVIRRIDGVFSGTLAYLFNNFDGSVPFSSIVSGARDEGYTEPDPRDDLSGLDVARKVVILAREMELDIDLADIELVGLVPAGLETGSPEVFLQQLQQHDDEMSELFEQAKAREEVLRFVGTIEPGAGCSVALRSLPADHPFGRGRHTDNIIMFETDRYSKNPLVIQGPGAGPDVTAGGVFADILRLANYLGATL